MGPLSGPGAAGRTAFQYPNFRYYMTARMLATIASEMQAVAVGWQIYALTHRALDLGLVGLGQFLPGILLFLAGGQTADRFPRQRILQCCYVAFACVSALLLGLTLRGLTGVWAVYAVLLVNGVVRAFNGPASQAFLPLVVPVEVFPSAVALGSGVFQGAMVVGPMVGGLVYGLTGSPAPVYAGSVAACLSAMDWMGRISGIGCVPRGDGRGTDGGGAGLWAHRESGAGVCRVGGGVSDRHGVDGADPCAGGATAARDRPAGSAAGWAALSLARQNDAGRGLARHVRGAAGRGGGADAGIREGHPGSGRHGIGDSARLPRHGRGDHGDGVGSAAAQTACGRDHAMLRRRVRRLHGSVRTVAKCGVIGGGAGDAGRVRHGQRGGAAYPGTDLDAG